MVDTILNNWVFFLGMLYFAMFGFKFETAVIKFYINGVFYTYIFECDHDWGYHYGHNHDQHGEDWLECVKCGQQISIIEGN